MRTLGENQPAPYIFLLVLGLIRWTSPGYVHTSCQERLVALANLARANPRAHLRAKFTATHLTPIFLRRPELTPSFEGLTLRVGFRDNTIPRFF